MKLGDLVKSTKNVGTIGIVVEIFEDLGEADPWIRVLFTHPTETYQWVKRTGLVLAAEEDKEEP